MTSIAVLALEHCMLSGVVGPQEILTIANSLVEDEKEKAAFSSIRIVGLQKEIVNFSGISLPVQETIETVTPQLIFVPPVFSDLDDIINNVRLIEWIKEQHKAGSIIAACCAGTFLLAEAGILDGKAATTHWRLTEDFMHKYPTVDLRPDIMLIDGGTYITAGGAMAWQDLVLHVISRFISADIASQCAKLLVMDGTRHTQTPYFMFPKYRRQDVSDKAIDSILDWMQQHYQHAISIDDLAGQAKLGERTFLRRFKRATGTTPLQYLQQLRIEAARHLLEITTRNIEEISGMVGYKDSSAFRDVFKKKTGLTPTGYRDRFSRVE